MNILGTFSFALLSSEIKGEEKQNSFQYVTKECDRSKRSLNSLANWRMWMWIRLLELPFLSKPFFPWRAEAVAWSRVTASVTFFPSSLSLSLPSSPDTQTAKMPNTPTTAEVFPTAPLFFHRRLCFVELLPVLPKSCSFPIGFFK